MNILFIILNFIVNKPYCDIRRCRYIVTIGCFLTKAEFYQNIEYSIRKESDWSLKCVTSQCVTLIFILTLRIFGKNEANEKWSARSPLPRECLWKNRRYTHALTTPANSITKYLKETKRKIKLVMFLSLSNIKTKFSCSKFELISKVKNLEKVW